MGLHGNGTSIVGDAGSDAAEIVVSRVLTREFGAQPKVAFVCQLPVVGIVPCVPGRRMSSREVQLTFTDYEPRTEASPDEQARRIARVAYETSASARESDKIRVIFEEGNETASVVRTYTFTAVELATETAHPPRGSQGC